MSVHNLNLLPYYDISKDGEEGEDGGHSRLAIYNEEGNVIDLEAIGEMTDTCSALICVCYHDNLMATVNQLLRSGQLTAQAPQSPELTVDSW